MYLDHRHHCYDDGDVSGHKLHHSCSSSIGESLLQSTLPSSILCPLSGSSIRYELVASHHRPRKSSMSKVNCLLSNRTIISRSAQLMKMMVPLIPMRRGSS